MDMGTLTGMGMDSVIMAMEMGMAGEEEAIGDLSQPMMTVTVLAAVILASLTATVPERTATARTSTDYSSGEDFMIDMPKIAGYLRKNFSMQEHDIEDILQIIRMATVGKDLRPETANAWAYTIARRQAQRMTRRRHRQVTTTDLGGMPEITVLSDADRENISSDQVSLRLPIGDMVRVAKALCKFFKAYDCEVVDLTVKGVL